MRVTVANGTGRCASCHRNIAKGTRQMVGRVGMAKYESRYHIDPTEDCKGFISVWWDRIELYVSLLSETQLAKLGLCVAHPDEIGQEQRDQHIGIQEEIGAR